jgi:hypothetical protein
MNNPNYDVFRPTVLDFLRFFSHKESLNTISYTRCRYISECCLLFSRIQTEFFPSEIASGVVYISKCVELHIEGETDPQKSSIWSNTMREITSYSEERVKQIALEIKKVLIKLPHYLGRPSTVMLKYKSEQLYSVSVFDVEAIVL